jgi:hypothetical protein
MKRCSIEEITCTISPLEPPHQDLRRSFSNSPLINKHIRSSLQVPSSPIHSTSSMDSVDSSENNPTGEYNFNIPTKQYPFSLDDIQVVDDNFDPFSSTAKEIKTDFYRRLIPTNLNFSNKKKSFYFSKAQELVGPESFTHIYNYLHDQRQKQSEDPTCTDDILLSGLATLSTNSYACKLINELVLHECLNELNERTQT